jgi:hypothetical protein
MGRLKKYRKITSTQVPTVENIKRIPANQKRRTRSLSNIFPILSISIVREGPLYLFNKEWRDEGAH